VTNRLQSEKKGGEDTQNGTRPETGGGANEFCGTVKPGF